MKIILTQLGRLAIAIVVLYGALLGLTLLVAPRADQHAALDSARADASLYLTEPKYVFWARSRLRAPSRKLLLLGASNTLVGFKRTQVQELLPEYEVHNLSVSGSNISQLRQVVELVREVQDAEARRQETYVLGLWYGLFASDRARWFTPDRQPGDTDIDIERFRYGFYRRGDAGPVALLPADWLPAGATLIHPLLVLDRTTRDLTRAFRAQLSGKPPKLDDAARDARPVPTSAEQGDYLRFWRGYMGDVDALSDAPFTTLERIVDTITGDGARVILADLPIPRWHARGSALNADYRRRMDALLPRLAAKAGVTLLHLQEADAESEFSDEVHPKPRATPFWAQQLARTVSPQKGDHEYRSSLREADSSFP